MIPVSVDTKGMVACGSGVVGFSAELTPETMGVVGPVTSGVDEDTFNVRV